MNIRLGSRFVAVIIIRVQNCRGLGFVLAFVLFLCGSRLGPVRMRWLRMSTIRGLALGVGVRQLGKP